MNPIDNTNYELWLLHYAEGDLSDAECATVEAWLEDHPKAAEELALYREAPRLEKDYNIPAYGGNFGNQNISRPLWSTFLRWNAAAAVVVALMLPSIRIGTMERMEAPVVVAENRMPAPQPITTTQPVPSSVSKPSRPTNISSISCLTSITSPTSSSSSSTPQALHDTLLPMEVIPVVEVSTLIAYEEETTPADTLISHSLIAHDHSSDWGDLLLAANDVAHETLSQSFGGRIVSRLLPDSRQLEETVVVPLRERANHLKSKLK